MGTAQVQYPEKRKHPRYTCDLGVEVRVAGGKSGYWGTIADICLGGCYVSSFSPLPLGTPVVLVIRTKNLEVMMHGTTVTFHPGVGMGIQFAGSLSPDEDRHLKDLIGDLAQPV
ncbi:MAG TPA: PilZ domain-containing protein [Candidatus Angelobacter sp.]